LKAVILSAGYGSRLQAPVPKSLVRFSNGKCLLDYQLEALGKLFPFPDIAIVVGFKKELIMQAAPTCRYLANDRFDGTNTAKSLLLALQHIDDDVLWMNGDVYAEPAIAADVAAAPGNVILVDKAKTSDEEVCYTTNAQGHVVQLAKAITDAEGESLGINKVTREDVRTLVKMLDEVGDKDYFERGIELGIERKLFSFTTVDVQNRFVKEMDFQADLDAIEAYLSKRG
jgi:choline kinase